MKNKKATLLLIIFSITFICAAAQVNVLSTKLVYTNDSATWSMQFRVENGFYVIAPDNTDNDGVFSPMQLKWTSIPEDLQPVNKAIWPLSNFHGQSSVFTEGDYTVKQVFKVTKKKNRSSGILEGKLVFQGCQEDRCFPPDEIQFKTSATAIQESGDSAWAKLEKMGGQIPPGKEAYQEYLQLRPLGKKRFEDRHLLMRMQLAEAFWKNYPQHPKHLDAMRLFLSADPYFIANSGNESLDTIESRPGMDWTIMFRSMMTDTMAMGKWLSSGEQMVCSVLNGSGDQSEKEQAAFSLFARDFRLASRNFGLLPRKKNEAYYWSAFEQVYWKSLLQRFREHMQNFAELSVLPDRAKDFLSALKGQSPAVAAGFWNELQQQTVNARQNGFKLLHQTATEQLMALKLERGEEALKMSFTALNKTEFQLEKLRGKVVLIDFWASWCKPCLNELPHLRTMLDKYNKDGFEIAGICLDSESALPRVKEIIQENKITWPQRFEGKGFNSDTYRLLYGINSLPTVWLLDKSGRIISTDARGAKLEPLIRKYLNEQ